MAVTFPTSPTDGQQLTVNGKTYTFSLASGTWNITGADNPIDILFTRSEFVATANQTTFSVTYNIDYPIEVFVNGLQYLASDYTATNGTSVIFNTGLPADAEVVIMYATSSLNAIPDDISDLTDTTNIIPADISDLTDTTGALSSGGGVTVYATRVAMPMSGNTSGDLAYVTENNRLYIWNGSGWFSVALINSTPTITNAPSSIYNLYANGSPTIITLAATDEDGDTLTWSYNAPGADGKATITQADNVFTITPLTDIADTSFTIDFEVTDGVNTSTATSTINIDNRAPIIDTGPAATYALATDGSPTVITLAATDPDGGSITWSYAATGLSGQATVVQDGNEFTITPATTPQEYADFTITFTASDSIESTSSDATTFSLTFSLGPADAWDETVLSIGTSSTNGLDNSTFIDRSTNSHTVTPTGTPVQTAFHPYLDNWSVEFSTDRVDMSSVLVGPTTSTFTVECWVNLFSLPTSSVGSSPQPQGTVTLDGVPGAATNYHTFGVNTDGTVGLRWFDGSPKAATGTTVLDLGKWYHIACVVNSNSVQLYVDGVAESMSGTTTLTNRNGSTGQSAFGSNYWTTFNGHISNLRVTHSAVYTSAFTPSSENLTSVTNTQLLTCQSNRFIDNSTSNRTLTIVNDPVVSAFNPFGQESEYAVGENKGSIRFADGINEKIEWAAFGGSTTGTIEFWMYPTTWSASSGNQGVWSQGSYAPGIFLRDNGDTLDWYQGGNKTITYQPRAGEWIHVAYSIDNGSLSEYVNGTRTATASVGGFSNSINRLGTDGQSYFDGYISDFRMTYGVARYSGTTMTVPTSPVSTDADTKIYLPMDNAGIFDKTGNHTLTAVGNTSTSTTQTKFADTAMYFDGTGDSVTIPNSSQFDFSNNATFTLEFWMYPVSLTGNPTINFVGKWTGGGGQPQSWLVYYESGEIRFLTTNFVYPKYTYSTLNQWVHIAVTSDGTNLRLFTDGILRDTVTGYSITEYDKDLEIGNNIRLGVEQPFNGYIENLQILKGVAKYTANFTVPDRTQGITYQAES